jgi:shikimate kinase/3-dehydroquinate synthase
VKKERTETPPETSRGTVHVDPATAAGRPGLSCPVFLGGFMASGKTTVGRLLAEHLGVPFLDTDDLVERRAGLSVAELFARRGEPVFRAFEAEAVKELLPLRNVVVALGGGVPTNRELRSLLLERGFLAMLSVSASTALFRAGSSESRPLLDPERAEALLASRAEAYASGHVTVDTEERTPSEVATVLLHLLEEKGICEKNALSGRGRETCRKTVSGGHDGEPARVFVGEGLLSRLSELVPTLPPEGPFVVSDHLVGPLFGDRVRPLRGLHLLPRGEEAKTLDRTRSLYDALAEAGIDRGDCIAALGGGTVGDAAGFAAATWLRGIAFLQCPTTLLAMVDSSLGGKVGVNLPQGKNLVGAFYSPVATVMDVATLRTLPDEDFRQGLAEVVKYGVGEDQDFLGELSEKREAISRRDPETLVRLVRKCALLKTAVVAEDEKETSGVRARLNLGHTVGHALEGASEYAWRHGDAVAAGLVVALEMGKRRGTCSTAFAETVAELLRFFGLPDRPDRSWEELLPFLARDKKFRRGVPLLVLPREKGTCTLEECSLEELRRAYETVSGGRGSVASS